MTINTSTLCDFYIPELANLICSESGSDSEKRCLNLAHFKQYPWPIEYHYNSRGFRDAEWPESPAELQNAIWVVGDSFTVGLGSPAEHTWPQVLAQKTGRRVINVSMDGASNAWISRRARAIIDQVAPDNVIVMWSYLHRTESADHNLSDLARRQHYSTVDPVDHLMNFEQCVAQLQNTRIHWHFIPDHFVQCFGDSARMYQDIGDPSWPPAPWTWSEFEQLPDHIQKELKDESAWHMLKLTLEFQTIALRLGPPVIHRLEVLDLARDGHHFDIQTSTSLVNHIIPALT